MADIANGTVPPVAWYKPTGNVNQHPGYANLDDGDAHIADLVAKLQAGPQWQHMVIIITYDEYGGQWDHVGARPRATCSAPASASRPSSSRRTPRRGRSTTRSTTPASTLRLITKRFGLADAAGPHGARHGAGQQRRHRDGRPDERADAPVTPRRLGRLLSIAVASFGAAAIFLSGRRRSASSGRR